MIKDCLVFGTILEDTSRNLREEIMMEFHYIGRLFLFCRPAIFIPRLSYLNFAFNTGNEGPMTTKESIYPTKKFGGGLCITLYDAERHRKLNKENRYLNIMNIMQKGIKPYATHLGLDISYFEKTFNRMYKMGFKGCRFILDPVKFSKDRKYKASLEVELIENQNSFNIIFINKSNQIIKRILTRSNKFTGAADNSVTLFSAIGRWRWLSNEEFVISNMHSSRSWIASPYREGCEFRERGNYNRPYGDFSSPRVVVWDEFWKMNGVE